MNTQIGTRSLLFAVLLMAGIVSVSAATTQAGTVSWVNETISIEIRHDGGNVDAYVDIPWSLKMTALDAMKVAKGLEFKGEWNRSLSDWFIISIAGVDNQGGGNKNWLFCVNGFPAGVGAGSYTLGPGAKVIWTFESGHPPKNCN